MSNILVPVDFTKTSFSALTYAMNFAKLLPDPTVTLLHVINGTFNTNEVMAYNPLLSMEQAAVKRMKVFVNDYPKEQGVTLPKVPIIEEIRFGIPGFTISEYVNEYPIDLVVMGTRDKHNIFDRILGSASSLAARLSTCPVMLIHENVKFEVPKKVVFGFDRKSDIEDALTDYRKLNNELQAATDFVHIGNKNYKGVDEQKAEIIEELFEDHKADFAFAIKTIQGDNIHNSLRAYCLSEDANILAMVHREEGLFSGLFGSNDSIKMAQEFHLPVMVFHEDND